MWSFSEVATIEQNWGKWYALVTLLKDGVPESFYIKFQYEPTNSQVAIVGEELALKKNLEDAPQISRSISREDFFSRFTNTEIAGIYRAAANNDDLFVYVKLLEINPIVNLDDPRVIEGLELLETASLIGAGRANLIRGI